jgi:hypothetical protein
LSISQPHFEHVQPPQRACLNDLGCRTCDIGEPHAGQSPDSRLMPHRFFVTVPITTNRMPRRTSEATTINITFITRSGISTLIIMSNTTKTAILPRVAFAYFMRCSQLIMLHKRWSVPGRVTVHLPGQLSRQISLVRDRRLPGSGKEKEIQFALTMNSCPPVQSGYTGEMSMISDCFGFCVPLTST